MTAKDSDLKNDLDKNLTDKLFDLNQKYSILYNSLPDLLRTIDTKGIILDCNKAYAEHLGHTKEEVIGNSIFDHVAKESFEAMRNSFESWKKTGQVMNKEVTFKRKNGTTFPVLISANNLYDMDGNLVGSNTVIRDITDLVVARKKLEEKNIQLQNEIIEKTNLVKERNTYLHVLTNELRSTTIQITKSADTLLSEIQANKELQIDILEKIRIRTKSIVKILSDINEIQKIEQGILTTLKADTNLSRLIYDIISKLEDDIHFHGCKVTTKLDDAVICFCDKNKMENVLTQIISNAIDFSPKGIGKIYIQMHKENTDVKIVVTDNGIGIESDKLDKIFTKFYQMDTSVLMEHGGAGLGLYLCKGIIESHSGKIWAESAGKNMGAEIHILLPLFDSNYNKIKKIS